MRAVEIARVNNWDNLWLETDSMMVIHAIKHPISQCLG